MRRTLLAAYACLLVLAPAKAGSAQGIQMWDPTGDGNLGIDHAADLRAGYVDQETATGFDLVLVVGDMSLGVTPAILYRVDYCLDNASPAVCYFAEAVVATPATWADPDVATTGAWGIRGAQDCPLGTVSGAVHMDRDEVRWTFSKAGHDVATVGAGCSTTFASGIGSGDTLSCLQAKTTTRLVVEDTEDLGGAGCSGTSYAFS